MTVTASSTTTAIAKVLRMIRRRSPRLSVGLSSACVISLPRSPSLLLTSSPRNAVLVMMPIPPTCIANRSTTWPKPDQCEGMSSVLRPVTVMAEVAVNSASRNPVRPVPCFATGSISSTVTTAMKTAKVTGTRRIGRRVKDWNRLRMSGGGGECLDLLGAARDDEGVAGEDDGVGGGVGEVLAGLLDADDGHAPLRAQLRLAEPFVDRF